MPEVSRATEEAREEVEWVMLLSLSATLLVLLDALMAVLVIDLSLLLVAENFVGFSYFYELLACRVVSTSSC